MKITCLFMLFILILSCNRSTKQDQAIALKSTDSIKTEVSQSNKPAAGQPVIAASLILTDFRVFWDYYYKNVKLYEDFLAYDTAGNNISKETFLKRLNSGLYLPLLIHSQTSDLSYKLYKIPSNADPVIASYMKQFSKEELVFYKMERKDIPAFNFVDVNGKNYTSENTKGKIVLFKCWFIRCVPCVQEMPALNELVKKYSGRKDIVFISLAIDNKKDLQQFLSKTRFDYATVPAQEQYMAEKLNVSAYPTHFLIGRDGKLVRVLHDDVQVAEALEKESAKL